MKNQRTSLQIWWRLTLLGQDLKGAGYLYLIEEVAIRDAMEAIFLQRHFLGKPCTLAFVDRMSAEEGVRRIFTLPAADPAREAASMGKKKDRSPSSEV